MARYYRRDTSGEDTNLQLYSLKQASRYWHELVHDIEIHRDGTPNVRERCVFVLASLGLSISQLLGQNNPHPSGKVPNPIEIFSAFVKEHNLEPALTSQFERFNYFYNGCRHFGLTTGRHGYDRVDQLTMPVARECYEFGCEIWKIVIGAFRKDPESDLADFNLEAVLGDL